MSHYSVTVIAPCRNEQFFIEDFVDSVFSQVTRNISIELVVADGSSSDNTLAILTRLLAEYPMLKVINNPGKIVSTGLNIAIANSKSDFIVRMDIHSCYSDDYIQSCVDQLVKTGCDCVGGPWKAIGKTPKQSAIASAFQSPISTGGAHSRNLNFSGLVDTVYLGSWPKRSFEIFGLFDESLVRNQDDEFCLRIRRMGGSIFQSSAIRSEYFPRSSFRLLFKQYYQYGFWKIFVLKRHKTFSSIRLGLILLVLSFILSACFFALIFGNYLPIYCSLGFLFFYYIIVALSSFSMSPRPNLAFFVIASIVMQISYCFGLFAGLFYSLPFIRADHSSHSSLLTR